jgi:HlyD family secretion protein
MQPWTMLKTAALAIAVAAAVLTATWIGHAVPRVHVDTAVVTAGPIARSVIATGTLEPISAVDVGSQASGTVTVLDADINSRVHAGDVIAHLDPSDVDTELARAQAAVTQAIADSGASAVAFESARTTLDRAQSLAARRLLDRVDLDAAQVAYNNARVNLDAREAVVERARAMLEQISADRSRSVIRSPIDGIVIARHLQVGENLTADEAPAPFRIATDLTHMRMQVSLDESDIAGLSPLGDAVFTVDAWPGQVFHGVLSAVRLQPMADATTTIAASIDTRAAAAFTVGEAGYTAVLDVDNSDQRLRPGMTAIVTLPGPNRAAAVRIPTAALSFRPQGGMPIADDKSHREPASASAANGESDVRRVWQFDGQAFRSMTVEVGVSDGEWTELLKGPLQAGDQLVTGADVIRHRHI